MNVSKSHLNDFPLVAKTFPNPTRSTPSERNRGAESTSRQESAGTRIGGPNSASRALHGCLRWLLPHVGSESTPGSSGTWHWSVTHKTARKRKKLGEKKQPPSAPPLHLPLGAGRLTGTGLRGVALCRVPDENSCFPKRTWAN